MEDKFYLAIAIVAIAISLHDFFYGSNIKSCVHCFMHGNEIKHLYIASVYSRVPMLGGNKQIWRVKCLYLRYNLSHV